VNLTTALSFPIWVLIGGEETWKYF